MKTGCCSGAESESSPRPPESRRRRTHLPPGTSGGDNGNASAQSVAHLIKLSVAHKATGNLGVPDDVFVRR
jgi:hypothetical protein